MFLLAVIIILYFIMFLNQEALELYVPIVKINKLETIKRKKLRIIKHPEVNLIHSNEVCPRIYGLQALETGSVLTKIVDKEPEGYCAAWSLFFTELSLKNPDIPSSELLNYIYNILERMSINQKSNYLKEIIRGYSVFINEKINKYFSIFFNYKSGITVEKLKKLNNTGIKSIRNLLSNLIDLEIIMITNPSHVKHSRIQTEELLTLATNYLKLNLNDPGLKREKEVVDLIHKKKMYEAYDAYNVFSDQSDSFDSKSVQPKQIVKEPVKTVEPVKKPCPEGKELNPDTGRCIKIKTQKAVVKSVVKTCPEGKEINPDTGRCIKIKTQKAVPIQKSVVKTCPEGKEINPTTGRCIKIKTQKAVPIQKSVVKTCPEGKELNPDTGRCIKIKTRKVK